MSMSERPPPTPAAPELKTTEEPPPPQRPLAPTDSVAGRSLVIVIAITTFLAALAAGAALLVADASADWRKELAREITVQVKPVEGRNLDADVEAVTRTVLAADGVREARPYTKEESEALLAPWLGEGLSLAELPTPRMVVVRIDPGDPPDLSRLRVSLAQTTPAAVLDDHRVWLERLSRMAGTVVAIAALVFVLIVVAMAVAVASATRAAVATNREIVEVLHLVGADDAFIASEFQNRFLSLGLRGAAVGGGAAAVFFLIARFVARRFVTTPGGEQVAAMFGEAALDARGFSAIFLLAAAAALATGFLSRLIVLGRLRELQ
jgi:cell division transport system permease protein